MSSRVQRIFVYGGLPLAVVMASAMIARAYDTSWIASGQTLSSAQLKANLDEVQSRLAALEAHPLTDWQSYTPSLTDNQNGTTIGNQTTRGEWRRVGDTLEVQVQTEFSGVPTGSGDCSEEFRWGLPNGLSIDDSKDITATGFGFVYGDGASPVWPSGSNGSGGFWAVTVTGCHVNATDPIAFDTGTKIELFATVPIASWGSGSGSGQ